MKKLILITILYLSTSDLIQGQVYHPFSTTTASWSYRYYDDFHNPTPCMVHFRMNGDTILNSLAYKKIYVSYSGSGLCFAAYPFQMCFMRESAKKIYFVSDTSNLEFLMFDFNVNAGDTLFNMFPSQPFGGCDSDTVVVWGIDSVLCSDGYHRRYYAENEMITEEIGNILGGLFMPVYCGSVSGGYLLECYSDSTETNIFPGGLIGPCAPLAVQSFEEKENLSVYPNPFRNEIHISHSDNVNITITNMLGQEIESILYSAGIEYLNTTKWCEGIYFIRTNSISGSESKRVIKQ
jgi:hypothetical protein